jgi:hypothetical protein
MFLPFVDGDGSRNGLQRLHIMESRSHSQQESAMPIPPVPIPALHTRQNATCPVAWPLGLGRKTGTLAG